MHYTGLHTSKVLWKVVVPEDKNILSIYGDRTKKDLLNTLKKIEFTDYNFKIEPITKQLLDVFIPLYKINIENIKEGNVYDMYDIILSNPKHDGGYESLSLYLQDKYMGSILFVISKKGILYEIAKVFPKTIEVSLKLNITFVAEYKLYEYASSKGISVISLGVDTNYFGKIGNIGLAIYKLRTGAMPYSPKKNNNVELEGFEFDKLVDDDTLIFLGSLGKKITSGKLFLNVNTISLDKYSHLLNNKKINIELIK
jgi:hypothetical protein